MKLLQYLTDSLKRLENNEVDIAEIKKSLQRAGIIDEFGHTINRFNPPNFPEGYLTAEAKYCKTELDIFHNSIDQEKIERYRTIILEKRKEFKKTWNLIHQLTDPSKVLE